MVANECDQNLDRLHCGLKVYQEWVPDGSMGSSYFVLQKRASGSSFSRPWTSKSRLHLLDEIFWRDAKGQRHSGHIQSCWLQSLAINASYQKFMITILVSERLMTHLPWNPNFIAKSTDAFGLFAVWTYCTISFVCGCTLATVTTLAPPVGGTSAAITRGWWRLSRNLFHLGSPPICRFGWLGLSPLFHWDLKWVTTWMFKMPGLGQSWPYFQVG